MELVPWNRFLGSLRLQIRAQATLDSGIVSLESIPGLLKRLQIWAQATLASGVGSLESIPGLSLSPYLEKFKEPRNRFQGTREPRNQGTRNQEPTLRIGEWGNHRFPVSTSRGEADSPFPRVGELLSELQ